MPHLHFDTEGFIAQIRRDHDEALTAYLAQDNTPEQKAFVLAQAELWPAKELTQRVMIGLREADRPPEFIAAVYGVLAGWILDTVTMNSPDPRRAHEVFCQYMANAFAGRHRIGDSLVRSVDGHPMGSA